MMKETEVDNFFVGVGKDKNNSNYLFKFYFVHFY